MASKNLWFVILVLCVVIGFGVTANAQEPLSPILEEVVDAVVLAYQSGMQKHFPHKIWTDSDFVESEIRPRWEKLVRAIFIEKTLDLNSKEYWVHCRSIGKKIAEAAERIIFEKETVRS